VEDHEMPACYAAAPRSVSDEPGGSFPGPGQLTDVNVPLLGKHYLLRHVPLCRGLAFFHASRPADYENGPASDSERLRMGAQIDLICTLYPASTAGLENRHIGGSGAPTGASAGNGT
jgi:hypothetical protein